jgi:D-alanyl-D-alanine dipeptidase
MVKVVSVKSGAHYSSEHTSGNTVDVTLTDGSTTVRVEGVLIFEDDADSVEEMFYDALDMAEAGEEGYVLM